MKPVFHSLYVNTRTTNGSFSVERQCGAGCGVGRTSCSWLRSTVPAVLPAARSTRRIFKQSHLQTHRGERRKTFVLHDISGQVSVKSGVRTGRDLRELKETDVCECDCVFVSICCVWTQIVLPFTLVFLSLSRLTHINKYTHTHMHALQHVSVTQRCQR